MSSPPTSTLITPAGFRIGHAHDARVRTGVTVILPDAPARAAVDVRGGGPGTRETDTLALGGLVEHVHAVVLSGGSVYGLAAADAVCAALGERRTGYVVSPDPSIPVSPIVPSAILFDNANGGDKAWGVEPPFARLGRDALHAVSTECPEGAVGAGFGATAGTYPGGFGMASERAGEATVWAMIAANPVGSPYMPGTDVPHAWHLERDGEFGGREPEHGYRWRPPTDTKFSGALRAGPIAPGQSTVIGVIATDASLSSSQLKRLVVMAQDGLALSVQPSHTPLDGDTLFALSVGETLSDSPPALAMLGYAAARATARALTRGVMARSVMAAS